VDKRSAIHHMAFAVDALRLSTLLGNAISSIQIPPLLNLMSVTFCLGGLDWASSGRCERLWRSSRSTDDISTATSHKSNKKDLQTTTTWQFSGTSDFG